MLLRSLISKGVETVSAVYPEMEAREMVFILLEHVIGTKKHTHIIEPLFDVPDDKVGLVESAIARLVSGEPLQYVIGTACFYGRDFNVTPSVLIPRPETEILCRMASEQLNDLISGPQVRVLDLCTGSGCIAWTMALECPGASVTAVDISDDALNIAANQDFSEEMSRTGAKTPTFLKADVLGTPSAEILRSEAGQLFYDLILSNPPYVMDKEKSQMRPNVLEHEPHLALFVSDEDPLIFYRSVARWSYELLSAKGVGIVEINEALGLQTAKVFLDAGFTSAEVVKDFSEKDRFVVFRR